MSSSAVGGHIFFDAIHQAFPLPRMAAPTLQGALSVLGPSGDRVSRQARSDSFIFCSYPPMIPLGVPAYVFPLLSSAGLS